MAIALEKLNKIDGDIFNGSDVGKIDSNNMIVQNKVNDLEDTTNNLQTKINNINSELDLKPSANDVVSLTSFQNHQNATNPHNTTFVSLKDVVLTNPTSDQVLGYDPLTSKIINKSNVGTISASADKLATSRKIGTSGDVTGTPTNFDGSADITIPMTLTNTGVTAGTYSKVTVDSKGRVTGGNSLTATDIPSLTLAKISDAGTSASKNVGVNPNDVVGVGSNGKIDTNLIPSIAITETFPVTSTAQMTLLTHAEIGDVAVVNPDGSHATSYILSANDPTVLTNWILLNTPSDVTTITGNAGSASKLQTARNINITGGATGTGSFDGSSDVNINVSLNDTYTKNEVDNLVNGKVSQATGYSLVADTEITKLTNITGTNTGDETSTSIKTKLGSATNASDGYLSSVDWSTFNNKQNKIIVQNTEPSDKTLDNLWINTASIPYKFMRSDGTNYNQIGTSESNQIVIANTQPTDTTKLWLDNTDASKPILKWYSGTAWISISGTSSSVVIDDLNVSATTVYSSNKTDSTYVKKETGKSLIADTEITRLSTVVNYDHSGVDTHIGDTTIHVTSTDKTNWSDKYTKSEIDTKFSTLMTNLDWKEAVNTVADLTTTYPDAEDGWTANVKSTKSTYRFDGTTWIKIDSGAIPLASGTVDGKMSSSDFTKLQGISTGANKVEASTTNGNIKIDGTETTVFTQTQSDWAETDNTKADFINNKPVMSDYLDKATYDADKDGIVDKAKTLDGLTSTTTQIDNIVSNGLQTSNVKSGTNINVTTSGKDIIINSTGTDALSLNTIPVDDSRRSNGRALFYNQSLNQIEYADVNVSGVVGSSQLTNVGSMISIASGEEKTFVHPASTDENMIINVQEEIEGSSVTDSHVDFSDSSKYILQDSNKVIFSSNAIKLKNGGIDSNTKLLLHFNNNLVDSSSSPKTITNSNVTFSSSVSKFGGYSAYFNGNSQLTVNMGSDLPIGSSARTFDFNINLNSSGGIVFWYGTLTSNSGFGLFITSGRLLQIGLVNTDYYGITALNLNTWYHCKIIYDGTNLKVYLNGNLEINKTVAITTTSTNFIIGNWNSTANYFNGYLDEFRISNIARNTEATLIPTNEYYDYLTNSPTYLKTTGSSDFSLTTIDTITSLTIPMIIPTNTSVKCLFSVDNGVNWLYKDSTGLHKYIGDVNQSWTSANTNVELQTYFTNKTITSLASDLSSLGIEPVSLDFCFQLNTTDSTTTPSISAITMVYIEAPHTELASFGGYSESYVRFGVKRVNSSTLAIKNLTNKTRKINVNTLIKTS